MADNHFDDNGNWIEYRRLILSELKRIDQQHQEVIKRFDAMNRRIWASIIAIGTVVLKAGIDLLIQYISAGAP